MTPSITIGFLPRERYSIAAESLASLYAHTPMPFELIVVDAATPQRHLDQMTAVLADHDNWRVLSFDRPMLPAESKNRILAETSTDYVCLLENDVLFSDGWLEALLQACEDVPADVAAPIIREGRGTDGHFDHHLGRLVASRDHPGKYEVEPLQHAREHITSRERVDFVEQHCVLFRRSVFDHIGPYDAELNTRDEVDLSLALHHAGMVVVLEPRSIINYVAPTGPPEDDELEYYRMRWDLARATLSRERIRDRWNLVDTPGDLEFVRYRNRIPDLPRIRRVVSDLCSAGRRVMVLDDGDWFDTDVLRDLPALPFPDAGGHFGGFPASDDSAVAELRTVLSTGVTDVIVGWPAQWWFDHLPKFRSELEEWAQTVERDDRLIMFSVDAPQ